MQGTFLKLAAWLLQKLAAAALIVLVAIAGYGFWLYLQEEGLVEERRVEDIQRAITKRDQLLDAQTAIEHRIAAIRAEVEKQKDNAKKADKIIATLRELENWWERWFGNREQQSTNVERMQRMEKLKGDALGQVGELQRFVTQAIAEKQGNEL